MKKNKSKNKKSNRRRNNHSYNSNTFSMDSMSNDNSISNNNNPYVIFETIIYPLPNELKRPIEPVIGHGNQAVIYFLWLFFALLYAFTSLILWEVILGKLLFITIEAILLVSFYALLKRLSKTVGYFSVDNDGFRIINTLYPNGNIEILWENICSEYIVHIKTSGRNRPDYLVFQYKNASNERKEYKLPLENWLNYSLFSPIEKRKWMLKAVLKGLARTPDIKINQSVFTKLDVNPKTFEFAPSKRRVENIEAIIISIIILGLSFILWTFLSINLPFSWALGLLLASVIPIFIGLTLFMSWLYPETVNNISYTNTDTDTDNVNK